MKKLIVQLFLVLTTCVFAQVGINTTSPNAQLDIQSTNQANPSNTDGLLIPRVDAFPAVNPGANQNGMLIFLTTTVGSNTPGFYYWNHPSTTWVPIGNNNNSGWNLNGNAITAGQFIGTTNDQNLILRRNNIRAGFISNNITAFGVNSLGGPVSSLPSGNSVFGVESMFQSISGINNSAFGHRSLRGNQGGNSNVAIGYESLHNTNGNNNVGIGFASLSNDLGGEGNTGLGFHTNVATHHLNNATAIGANAQVSASNSLVLGSINGVNGATADVNVGIGTTSPLNKLHLHTNSGNLNLIQFSNSGSGTSATDGFLIGINSTGEAGIINTSGGRINFNDQLYIDGDKLGIGDSNPTEKLHIVGSLRMVDGNEAIGRVMVSNANGTATWTDNTAVASGTLDQAYDFGGTGNGNTITADSGAVLINGTDGLVSTGTLNSGIIAPSGAGIRMVWNPRKAAFRAGQVSGTQWDDVNIGRGSTAFGSNTTASGINSTAFGVYATASGITSTAFGASTTASGEASTAFNSFTTASGITSTAFGFNNTASGTISTAFGLHNSALSVGETVLGIGSTIYTPSANGVNQFGVANATDRLFVIGNAVDANSNNFVDDSERSDAIVVLKNGNVGIGTSTPTTRVNVLDQNRNSSIGNLSIMTSTLAQDAGGKLVLGGAFQGLLLAPYGTVEGLNADGAGLSCGYLRFLTNNCGSLTEKMRISHDGDVGIGIANPNNKLHVFSGNSGGTPNSSSDIVIEDDTNVYQHFLSPNANESGLLFGSDIAPIHGGIIFDNSDQDLSFRTGGNTTRMTLASSGNLGLGTATPSRNIHVLGNSTSTTNGQLYLEQSGTGDAIMHIGNTGARHYNLGLDTSTENFKIATHATIPNSLTSTTLVTVQPTGEVGVGTTVPNQKLHVSGSAGLTAIKITNTSTAGATSNVALDFQRGGNANTDWRIYNIGPNLTIGNSGDELATINDLYQFQGSRFMPMNDGVINLGQGTNKWNTVFAQNGAINTSDARQKKNIKNLSYGLDKLMQLRPVSFEWKKDDGSGTKLGLIAQELQQVIPEVVRDWDWEEDELGNRKKVASSVLGVYYSDLIPVLIKATQDQQNIIDQQNKKIESQQNEIELLKQQFQKQYTDVIERIKKLEESK